MKLIKQVLRRIQHWIQPQENKETKQNTRHRITALQKRVNNIENRYAEHFLVVKKVENRLDEQQKQINSIGSRVVQSDEIRHRLTDVERIVKNLRVHVEHLTNVPAPGGKVQEQSRFYDRNDPLNKQLYPSLHTKPKGRPSKKSKEEKILPYTERLLALEKEILGENLGPL